MYKFKGIISVILGAASYGLLATVVKYGNLRGLDVSVLTFFQYFLGFLGLVLFQMVSNSRSGKAKATRKSKTRLFLFGTSLGITSCFYYLAIQYIPVSIAIILLMQAIWMGGVLEMVLDKTKPEALKIIGSIIVLIGTVLAVNIFENIQSLSFLGIGFGLLASISYTITLTATNRVESGLPNIIRSKYLVLGGLAIVVSFWNIKIFKNLDLNNPHLLYFGLFLGIFGCIIPPILFNKGFPIIGIGLGSILSAIEIPVSIFSAKILLNEEIKWIQWVGVLIIIISVIIINLRYLKFGKKSFNA
ncbi:EamA/RhaT family transporter [Aequorivita sp. H23M31]|uniref:EamA/RhaT family transporter n=1 Tax=Aequorivita ciconiae TaxID=2494375 RepID=A0A410G6I9_9FLAO|nr:EamA family transporter [Aequorivita sp. H23M31]QAA82897.1 EamA/RhaT family transporter [Aequorivita sp. H23M31]